MLGHNARLLLLRMLRKTVAIKRDALGREQSICIVQGCEQTCCVS